MTVGWYVHHHGAGHAMRLQATLPYLDGVVALTSREAGVAGCEQVALPLDLDPAPVDPTAAGTLHWVPRGNPGLRDRMSRIAGWIASARPDAMVVDVSVEVALLARLHGCPVVLVLQRGRRTDAAHALAYAQADALVAPWTAATEPDAAGLPERTHRVGAISRLDAAFAAAPAPPPRPGGDVLLLLGAGGHDLGAAQVEAAAAATPERTWHVVGTAAARGPNVVAHGAGADVEALLRSCSVVVGSAGGNVVAEVAAARRPYVCLPQERPFGEQHGQADALRRLGTAEVRDRWPAVAEWPALLAAAEARPVERWALLHDGGGAGRLAAVVREVAAAR